MRRIRSMFTTLLFLALIIAGYCFRGKIIQALHDGNQVPVTKQDFVVIAHRGASAYAPENTLPAFEKALEMKADWIELDLHASKDGMAIVIHDASLERTTSGQGLVKEKTWEELSGLDAGQWFEEEFKGTKIPSLPEVLQQVNGKAKLLIELKVDEQGNIYPDLVNKVAQDIADAEAHEWCILQAFNSEYLEEIKNRQLKTEYHKLIVDEFSPLPIYVDEGVKWGYLPDNLGFQALNPYYVTLTPGRIQALHRKGLKVFPYTVNDVADMRLLLNWGVDGLITNYPDKAMELKNKG